MTAYDALLGTISKDGVELELGSGLNFTGGVTVVRNPATQKIDINISGGGGGSSFPLSSDVSAANHKITSLGAPTAGSTNACTALYAETVANSAAAAALATALAADPLVANANPADVTKAAASQGVSARYARQDHKHDASTAVVAAFSVSGVAAAEGTATTLARSDHAHSITGKLPYANFVDGAACSLVGVTGNAGGAQASIALGTNGFVALRRSNAVIGGLLLDENVDPAAAIVVTKLVSSAAARVFGRTSASAGAGQELTCGVGVRVNGTAIELSALLAPLAAGGTALQQVRYNAGATAFEFFSPPNPVVGADLTNANATKNISDGSQFTLPASTLATSAKTLTLGTSGTPEADEIIEVIVFSQSFDFNVVDGGAIGGTLYTVVAGTKRVLHFQWNASAGSWVKAGKIRLA